MTKSIKKIAAGFAGSALLLASLTPAAFAGYNHSNHMGYDHDGNHYEKTSSYKDYGFRSNRLFVTLEGEEEVPGPGDPNGFGVAKVQVYQEEDQVCVKLRVLGIQPATAAHIHDGADNESGPVVANLPTPNDRGKASGCVDVSSELADKIADNPSEYYVNIHNSEYPDGALRGQLY